MFYREKTINKNKQQGFTLIELLVVISIIGLLSSIILVSTVGLREKARMAAARSFASQTDRVAGDQAVGEWFLNEGSGTAAYDGSGNNNNGILQNGPAWSVDTPSDKDYALFLDGLNDYLQVQDTSLLKYKGGNLTLAVWVKPSAAETGGYIFSKPWNGSGQYNYGLYYQSSGKIGLSLMGTTGFANNNLPVVPKDKWTFIAVTLDSANNISVYIDGALKYSGSHTVSSWVPSAGDLNIPLAIGTLYPYGSSWSGNVSYSFNGLIDDPRVFAKALVAEQVGKLYASGLPEHLFASK